MIKNYLLGILFLHISLGMAWGNVPVNSGLYFSSHEVNQDLRTSLNLTPSKPLQFEKGFGMEFEASFRPGDGYFGYVFRIISDHLDNIDLVVNLNSTRTNFWLVHQDKNLISLSWEDIGGQQYNSWIPIKLIIDPGKNLISLEMNGRINEAVYTGNGNYSHAYEVVYGMNKTANFVSTDVAPMKIRNIGLFEPNGNVIAFWKMDKHQQEVVYDEIEGKAARVTNPVWEINRHVNWGKLFEFSKSDLLGTVINTDKSKLYLIGSNELHVVDLLRNTLDKYSYEKGNPYFCRSNPFVFDKEGDRIISYSFDDSIPSVLDLNTMEWSHSPLPCDLPRYWHHNKYFRDNKVFTFGGYGLFTYKSELQQFDLNNQSWVVMPLSEFIEPRYLSAMGQLEPDEWYVFGGYGTKSGAQQAAPRNYYDLYRLNPENGSVEKIWELQKNFPGHFVPVDKLIPTPEKDGFFTLIYDHSQFNTSLKLARIYLDTNRIDFFEDTIPYTFRDTDSWSSLYLLPGKQELLAMTQNQGKIVLYELAFPPLLPSETLQIHPMTSSDNRLIYLLGGLGTAFLLVMVYLKIAEKSKFSVSKNTSKVTPVESRIMEPIHIRQTHSAFYFLGGFHAFDKSGRNITSEFTPTIRQLFLLIYFYGSRGREGITSVKLKEFIWPDKSDVSAKNNRNVNISKLRLLLEQIGDFKVSNEESYWKITFDKEVYSDYEESTALLAQINQNETLPQETIIRLIQLLSYGELCPNIQNDWMDPIKVNFANITIDSLLSMVNKGIIPETNQQLLLSVAETILIHDVLNEEALKIKCNALFRMGKTGMAVQAYEKFAKEYEKMMGVPYRIPISEVL